MADKKIIGFDAKRIVRNSTGLGNYCRTIVRDMAEILPSDMEFRLYAPDKGRDRLRLLIEESESCRYEYPKSRCRSGLGKSLWRTRGIVGDLKRDGVDVYHGLSGELPIGIRKSGVKSIVTVHDLIFMRHPEYYNRIDAWLYTWKFHATCREADRIVAVSECTKCDIVELGGVSPDKIDVVYQSCNPRYSRNPSPESVDAARRLLGGVGRYVLSVGSIEERKNALLAVKALRRLPSDVSLVLVGKATPYSRKVMQYAQSQGLADRVLMLHGVGDAELHAIYSMADVFVYPSRYEGFGIPIIEAIHCGLPVAACTGSCLEEAGGDGCLYSSPDDDRAFAEAVECLLTESASGRQQRIAANRSYVKRFEGSDAAAKMISIYKEMI